MKGTHITIVWSFRPGEFVLNSATQKKAGGLSISHPPLKNMSGDE